MLCGHACELLTIFCCGGELQFSSVPIYVGSLLFLENGMWHKELGDCLLIV